MLCDQLEAPGALERCRAFLRDVRPASHALDIEAADDPAVAAELERAAGEYAAALERLPDDLLGRARAVRGVDQRRHARASCRCWPPTPACACRCAPGSSRTARASATAGTAASGCPSARSAPWLHGLLEEAGVHATCVDLTDVFGPGDPRHLRPLATEAGPLLVPIDRAAVDLVWAPSGYPSHAAYRDHHHRTARDHHPWANDGAVYDPARAAEQAASDAADFVARVAARVADGGLCVCALDTELLGVWWHEGPQWLALVVRGGRARAGSSSCTSTTRWPTAIRRRPARRASA